MDLRTANPTCSYCGCGLLLEVLADKAISTLPVKTHPVSQGSRCVKSFHEFVGRDQRPKPPLKRRDGKLVPVSWDEDRHTAARS